MISFDLKNRRTYIIAGLVLFFCILAFWLRYLPALTLGKADILTAVGSDDPLYNLRQVEQIIVNFPNYAWYDPMTLFPVGTHIYWGPLFTFISACACILAGATTRPEIIAVSLLVPLVMASITVAIMYFVGKTCGDWKTGLLASGLTAVVSGQFYYRSLYGYFDHHIGEVLFSTLFCLVYMYAVLTEKDAAIDLKNIATYKKTIFLSVLGGIAYILGLLLMPTMILFAMIVGIFTLVQFIIDFYRNRTSEYLLIINTVIFVIALLGLLAFGFKAPTLDLSNYTIGHVFAYLALIGGTWVLYGLAHFLKEKERYFFPALLLGAGILFGLVLWLVSPQIFNLLFVSFWAFFGQQAITNTVQEARPWALDLAWTTFNYGLILFAGGALVMLYNNIRDEHPHQIFALIWSVVILFSTWQHVRYEYYFAVNVVLLSAVCLSFAIEWGGNDIRKVLSGLPHDDEQPDKKPDDKGKKKKAAKKTHSARPDYIPALILLLVAGLTLLFAYTSFMYDYTNSVYSPIRMNGDWKESLEWMGNNTPDTGVNYYTIYNPDTFKYPPQAYGVMSWWDYGHMITYIAKRIPNANPFQEGVAGPNGSAAYFMSTSEDNADKILDNLGTRYIVTDVEMDTGKFWAMATWYNTTAAATPYQQQFFAPGTNDPTSLQAVTLNTQQYYLTMISRLHNFDGSMTNSSSVYYIEYADPSVTHVDLPVISSVQAANASTAKAMADKFNVNPPTGYHAAVLSPSIVLPDDTVPALQHYRLVHESDTNVFSNSASSGPVPDVRYVKIFEYVKGAHIKGNGIIEVPVVTNTGRNYTYMQESVNGEFVVPYSTTGNPYGVMTTGKYQIVGTTQQFDVPESAVMQGLAIN